MKEMNRPAPDEVVAVEVGAPEHPWLKWARMWRDDPTYDDFLAAIEAYRREVDAEQNCADLSQR